MKRKLSVTEAARTREALEYLVENPDIPVAAVAREFDISRKVLKNRLIQPTLPPPPTHTTTRFSYAEERAICRYIDRLDAINLAVQKEFVVDVANAILREKVGKHFEGPPPHVGKCWVDRFLKRHNYSLVRQKQLESNRYNAEKPKVITTWFAKLAAILIKEGITPNDLYNMDETGFQIGIGKDQLVITKRKSASYFSTPMNRESATVIECINAIGEVIPPFIILSGATHMAKWYQIPELYPNTSITVSPTGYANDEISLEWIKHFNLRTKDQTIGKKRLLIMDGYSSHHTREFI